eukprot:7257906-Pyramimonas_sp.AAC.1
MEPDVPKENFRDSENLRDPGALMRLDTMIATDMLQKFAQMKRSQLLSAQHSHFFSRMNRLEQS